MCRTRVQSTSQITLQSAVASKPVSELKWNFHMNPAAGDRILMISLTSPYFFKPTARNILGAFSEERGNLYIL